MAGSANVGTMWVGLKARTAAFRRGMKKAHARTMKFVRAIPGMNMLLSKFGALATGVAIGGLALLIKREMTAADITQKFADRIGIQTEKLVGLQLAGRRTGNEVRNLNLGLQRMTRRVSEAAKGTGEAQDALKELGLDAKALNKLAPDEQFKELAGAMVKVENQGDRVRLAMRLFDTEGVALVNTLALGRDGLEKFDREAKKLGLTFTNLEGKQIARANDAMNRLGDLWRGTLRRAAIELAPIIEHAATKLVNMATAGEGMGVKVTRAVEWVVVAGAKMRAMWMKVQGVFLTLKSIALDAFAAIVLKASSAMHKVAMAVNPLLDAAGLGEISFNKKNMDAWARGIQDDAAAALLKAGKKFNVADKLVPGVRKWFKELRKDMHTLNDLNTKLVETETILKKLGMDFRAFDAAGMNQGKALEEMLQFGGNRKTMLGLTLLRTRRDLLRQISKLSPKVAKVTNLGVGFGNLKLANANAKTEKGAKDTKEKADEAAAALKSMGQTAASSLVQVAAGFQKAGDAAKAFVATLLQQGLSRASNLLFDFLFGARVVAGAAAASTATAAAGSAAGGSALKQNAGGDLFVQNQLEFNGRAAMDDGIQAGGAPIRFLTSFHRSQSLGDFRAGAP